MSDWRADVGVCCTQHTIFFRWWT